MPSTAFILLDKNYYYPGDEVGGRVVVEAGETLLLEQLEVTAWGLEEVELQEDEDNGLSPPPPHSAGTRRYNRSDAVLYRFASPPLAPWGGSHAHSAAHSGAASSRDLAPGRHEFPFVYCLPHGVPQTASLPLASVAAVSHRIVAVLHAQGPPSARSAKGVRRMRASATVRVEPPLPGPGEVDAPGRVQAASTSGAAAAVDSEHGGSASGASGGVTLVACSDKRTYCPGEVVRVAVLEACNTRNVQYGRLKAELVQICTADAMEARIGLARYKHGLKLGPRATLAPGADGQPLEIELPLLWDRHRLLTPTLAGGRLLRCEHVVKVSIAHSGWLRRALSGGRPVVRLRLPVAFRAPGHEPQAAAAWVTATPPRGTRVYPEMRLCGDGPIAGGVGVFASLSVRRRGGDSPAK